MKYKIEEHKNGIDISINDIKDNKKELLESFQACKEGRCSCPTEEYNKLDTLKIEDNPDHIDLHLKSKDGVTIDAGEIKKCIEHTKNRIKAEKNP